MNRARLITACGKTYYGKILDGAVHPRTGGGTKKKPLTFGKIVLSFELEPANA